MDQEYFEKLLNKKLDQNHKFEFKCNQCGKCCEDRSDIILSAMDLHRIANYLCLDPESIIQRYCNIIIGHSSKLPLVVLKPVGRKKVCPFLNNRKCSIHEVKPILCAIYPIGRIYEFSADEPKVGYIFNDIECGEKGTFQTVAEWMKNIPSENDCSGIWQSFIKIASEIALYVEKNEKMYGQLYELQMLLFSLLYLNYDSLELMAQNMENKIKMLIQLKKEFIK